MTTTTPTQDDLRAALRTFAKVHGPDAANELLAEFGGRISAVPENKIGIVISRATAKMRASGRDENGRKLSPADELTRQGLDRNDAQKQEWADRHMPKPDSKDGQK